MKQMFYFQNYTNTHILTEKKTTLKNKNQHSVQGDQFNDLVVNYK